MKKIKHKATRFYWKRIPTLVAILNNQRSLDFRYKSNAYFGGESDVFPT